MKKTLICAALAVAYMVLGVGYLRNDAVVIGTISMVLGTACVAMAVADAYFAGRDRELEALKEEYARVQNSWKKALAAQDEAREALLNALRILDTLERELGEVCTDGEAADGNGEERPV